MPSLHGNTKLNPGPLKNDPKIVTTAAAMKNTVNMEIASFRSDGLTDGFLSMYGMNARAAAPNPGNDDAGNLRIEIGKKLLQSEEVPRCLGRVWLLIEVGKLKKGCIHEGRKQVRNASMTSNATNSIAKRCGHTFTLS